MMPSFNTFNESQPQRMPPNVRPNGPETIKPQRQTWQTILLLERISNPEMPVHWTPTTISMSQLANSASPEPTLLSRISLIPNGSNSTGLVSHGSRGMNRKVSSYPTLSSRKLRSNSSNGLKMSKLSFRPSSTQITMCPSQTLKGQTVDFDKIHTHRLSIATSTKESRRIAEGVDFVIGESEPTKYIRNAHEWQDAWDRFYKAVKFISPHRKQELKDYHDWIKGWFKAYHPSAHYRVLNLDRKIRVEAASQCDLVSTNTHILKPPSPATLVMATLPPKQPRTKDPADETNGTHRESKRSKFPATGSTKDAVLQLLASVNTSTSAPIAEKAAMLWRNAPIHLIGLEPARPKFHRGLLWTLDEDGHSPTALLTLYDTPLPRPQPNKFHPVVLNTIARNPLLFKLITPINIEVFELLLLSHRNQPFIKSVLTGLREGFWPFANTHADSYPSTHNASLGPPKSEKQ